ncbi:hypothetical protein QE381_003262 [Microbacterium sp. SORGH_AS 888]|nr:hypothetical protein [Microbacterium sp. SORGH_AS_0888]
MRLSLKHGPRVSVNGCKVLLASRQRSDRFSHTQIWLIWAGRDDFTITFDGEERTFLQVAQLLLPSELAIQLIRAGYIDRNFTLYSSTFHANRVSLNATNFVLKNIEPNIIDMAFPLEPADVEAIIRDAGEEVLTERSAYNVTLVNYLIAERPKLVEFVVTQLLRHGPDEIAFLNSYIESGANSVELIRRLASRAAWIFEFLIVDGAMDDDRRLKLVNAALANASSDLSYRLDESIRDYLVASYAAMPSLADTSISESQAKTIATIISLSGAILPKLDGLSRNIIEALIQLDAYVLSRENILTAVGDPAHSLTLNAIAKSSREVYERALQELPDYLGVLKPDESPIDDAEVFGEILNDAVEIDERFPAQIVQRVADGFILESLIGVTTLAWPELARSGHLAPTFGNVRAFIDSIGLTASLAAMLTAHESIKTDVTDDEAAKLEVALTLLAGVDVLPSAKLRADLVRSLRLENYVAAASIPVEKGELVGWLIDADVISDDATAFTAIAAGDKEGRIFAISKSSDFAKFMDAALVPPLEVGQIMQSPLTPREIKAAIIDRFDEFTVGSGGRNLGPIAREALTLGKILTIDQTIRLATQGVLKETVIATMQPHLSVLSEPQIADILSPLGGNYAQLTARNGRHPRIPNTPEHQAIVDRLIALGVAKTSSVVGSDIKVNMKKG